MKPARSPHETATLPTFSHRARVVSVTSSSVATVETTSTSFMIGAGLKKCMPMTSCGRLVTWAQLDDRQRRRGGREDRAGLADLVEVLEERGLDREVLGDRLDHDVDVLEVVERGGARAAGPAPRPWPPRSSLPRWIALSRALGDRRDDAVDLVLAAADVQHVVPGLGEDLDDAGGHGAGADDADQLDVVAELRLVVGGRGLVRRRRRPGCPGPRRCRSRGRSCGRAGRR